MTRGVAPVSASLHVFGAVIALLVVALPVGAAAVDDSLLRDVVAVASDGPRAIVLASWSGGDSRPWRVRRVDLDVDVSVGAVTDVVLSRSAAKAIAQTEDGWLLLVDLTERGDVLVPERRLRLADRTLVIDQNPHPRSHPRLNELFPIALGGRGYVIDDRLTVLREYDAVRDIAIRRDGAVVVVSNTGAVLRDRQGDQEQTVCHVSPDRDVVLVSADDATDGVLVVTQAPGSNVAELPCYSATTVPVLPMRPLVLAAASGFWPSDAPTRTALVGAVSALESVLPSACWRIRHVSPDREMYVPILEFATQERVFPSSTEIWRELWPAVANVPMDKKLRQARLYAAYLRVRGQERCTIYSSINSYPGTWLIQYWLYSPFDVGGRGPHLHDSEHFFVEVDKLGGMVRRMLGSGHGGFAGNNLFDATRAAVDLGLPLFAMVELGKHATAPDTDGNGFFVPGIDENHYNERSKVWGIRDVIGSMKNELLPYDATMTIPRTWEGRVSLQSFSKYFDATLVPAQNQTCALEPFPRTYGRCSRSSLARGQDPAGLISCATKELLEHPDAIRPNDIFKPTAYAPFFVRVTLTGYSPWSDLPVRRFMVEMAADLDRVPVVRRLSLPGRVAFGVAASVSYEPFEINPLVQRRRLIMRPAAGVAYEQFTANLFGFFVAVRQHRDEAESAGVALSIGPLVEFPLLFGMNLTFRPALALQPGETNSRFEMNLSIGGFPIGRQRFGY